MYVVSELSSEIFCDGMRHRGKSNSAESFHAAESMENNTCAAVHLSEDGRYLCASNRGHDSIAVYAVDAGTGLLTLAGRTGTKGKTPRDF